MHLTRQVPQEASWCSSYGLYNPASIAFGTGKGDRQSVFIANYAVFPDIPDFGGVGKSKGPAVLKYDVGVPGLPLP